MLILGLTVSPGLLLALPGSVLVGYAFGAGGLAVTSYLRDWADFQLIQYGEYLLASAIGAASSRLVLSLLLRKRAVSTKAALKLLDDASAAIHYNREILQTALDHVRQGIAVFDKDLALVCWNRQFGEIFDLPHALTRVGIALDEILRHIAGRGAGETADLDAEVALRIARYASPPGTE